MDKVLILVVLIIIVIIYFLLASPDSNSSSNVINDDVNDDSNEVYILSKDNKFLVDKNKTLSLTDAKSANKFIIHSYNKNNIVLESSESNLLVSINYTISYNNTYTVLVDGCNVNNNSSKLKLLHSNGYYYIKFFNNYYMCIDHNGNVYASKDKSKIFFFTIKKKL